MEEIFFAGGCLWGVQEFIRYLPGVIKTQAGRANGTTDHTLSDYDGYAECVLTQFNPDLVTLEQLIDYFFEIINPYSKDKQGRDIGKKYRTGIYSRNPQHLKIAQSHLQSRKDASLIRVEVLPLSNYVKSDPHHQDRLTLHPEDYCHIPKDILYKYRDLNRR